MKVGDIVTHEDVRGLHSGASLYASAVVAHTTPLVLVSHGGDMVWYTMDDEADQLTVVGTASVEVLCNALQRMAGEDIRARAERVTQ